MSKVTDAREMVAYLNEALDHIDKAVESAANDTVLRSKLEQGRKEIHDRYEEVILKLQDSLTPKEWASLPKWKPKN